MKEKKEPSVFLIQKGWLFIKLGKRGAFITIISTVLLLFAILVIGIDDGLFCCCWFYLGHIIAGAVIIGGVLTSLYIPGMIVLGLGQIVKNTDNFRKEEV